MQPMGEGLANGENFRRPHDSLPSKPRRLTQWYVGRVVDLENAGILAAIPQIDEPHALVP
jgi:hypothetical protein